MGSRQTKVGVVSRLSQNDPFFHNKTKRLLPEPDPLVRLIGRANELEIVVGDTKSSALINSGAQLSTITVAFTQQLQLEIHHLH